MVIIPWHVACGMFSIHRFSGIGVALSLRYFLSRELISFDRLYSLFFLFMQRLFDMTARILECLLVIFSYHLLVGIVL